MLEYGLAKLVNENKGDAACVAELDDITTCRAERGILHKYWKQPVIDLDYAMEGYLCTQCDGVLHQWSPDVENELRERHGGLVRAMAMQPYPLPELIRYNEDKPSKKDGVPRITWAGAILPYTSNLHPEIQNMIGMAEGWGLMLKQGLGVEIYVDPSKEHDFDGEAFEPYRALHDLSPYFAFGAGVPPDQASAHIGHCDFGMIFAKLNMKGLRIRPSKTIYDFPNKFFSYMEAGLPVIVNAEFEYIARKTEEWGVGFAVHSDDIDSLADRVRDFDYGKALAAVKRFNETHNMSVKILDLMAFYAKCRPSLAPWVEEKMAEKRSSDPKVSATS